MEGIYEIFFGCNIVVWQSPEGKSKAESSNEENQEELHWVLCNFYDGLDQRGSLVENSQVVKKPEIEKQESDSDERPNPKRIKFVEVGDNDQDEEDDWEEVEEVPKVSQKPFERVDPNLHDLYVDLPEYEDPLEAFVPNHELVKALLNLLYGFLFVCIALPDVNLRFVAVNEVEVDAEEDQKEGNEEPVSDDGVDLGPLEDNEVLDGWNQEQLHAVTWGKGFEKVHSLLGLENPASVHGRDLDRPQLGLLVLESLVEERVDEASFVACYKEVFAWLLRIVERLRLHLEALEEAVVHEVFKGLEL